jgi:hypothetical protein
MAFRRISCQTTLTKKKENRIMLVEVNPRMMKGLRLPALSDTLPQNLDAKMADRL